MAVLVVGTLSFDVIGSTTGELRADSLTVPLNSIIAAPGGRGANCAVLLAALGHPVRLVSSVGEDFAGSLYRADLEARGVDAGGLLWSADGTTPRVFVFSNQSDSRVFLYRDRRAERDRDFTEWTREQARQWPHDVLYCTSEIPEANRAALTASSSQTKVFVPGHDILSYARSCMEDCLTLADVLIVNSTECRDLEHLMDLQIPGILDGMAAIIVTRGADGSLIYTADRVTTIASCPTTQVVDTTGAGDAYAAGFVHRIFRSGSLVDAAKIGSATASFVIESPGCQPDLPAFSFIEARAAQCETIFEQTP